MNARAGSNPGFLLPRNPSGRGRKREPEQPGPGRNPPEFPNPVLPKRKGEKPGAAGPKPNPRKAFEHKRNRRDRRTAWHSPPVLRC